MNKILQSSIDISLPELSDLTCKWRDKTVDVAQIGVPPHITLLWPWCPPPITNEYIERLETVIEPIKAFTIVFNSVSTFGSSVIYLNLQNKTEVKGLMNLVGDAFPEYPIYENKVEDPQPHLTVSKPKSQEEFSQHLEEIQKTFTPLFPLRLQVSKITIMSQDTSMQWNTVKEINLKK